MTLGKTSEVQIKYGVQLIIYRYYFISSDTCNHSNVFTELGVGDMETLVISLLTFPYI